MFTEYDLATRICAFGPKATNAIGRIRSSANNICALGPSKNDSCWISVRYFMFVKQMNQLYSPQINDLCHAYLKQPDSLEKYKLQTPVQQFFWYIFLIFCKFGIMSRTLSLIYEPIIIIIKKGQQCKAGREWYTPY